MIHTDFRFRPWSLLVGVRLARHWAAPLRSGGAFAHRDRRTCAETAMTFGGPTVGVRRTWTIDVFLPLCSLGVVVMGRAVPAGEILPERLRALVAFRAARN